MWNRVLIAWALFLSVPLGVVLAQSEEGDLQIHLRRTFGYQGGTHIQGRFTLEASSATELVEVYYLIDGERLARVTESPYQTSFSTGDFPQGEHVLNAYGIDAAGEQIEAQPIRVTFVSAEEGWQTGGRIAVRVLGGVLVLLLVGALGMTRLSRVSGGFELGVYSTAGGAVCGRCQLPFSRHVFSPNLVLGKLERCPHCGRVAIVPRSSQLALAEAEERFRKDRDQGQRELGHSEQGGYQQQIDDSRFDR